jgi:hypothetical protein
MGFVFAIMYRRNFNRVNCRCSFRSVVQFHLVVMDSGVICEMVGLHMRGHPAGAVSTDFDPQGRVRL